MRPPNVCTVSGLLALVLVAGSEAASSQPRVARRDSLGVDILEAAELGPRVAASELVRIGEVNGPRETTFYRIRDARVGPGGFLFVLDGGDRVIKVFDGSGRVVRTFGGPGEGPAEFGAPWQLELRGDTVRVLDIDLRKLVTFSTNGDLLSTRRLGFSVSEHGLPESFATRPDGRLFIVGVRGCGFPRRPTDNQWGLYRFGADGAVEDTLERRFIGNTLPVYTGGRRASCTVLPWPFAPGPTVAFDPAGGAFWSPGDVFEIHRLDATLTRVTAVMRYPVPRRPVTGAHRRAFQDLLDARENLDRELRRAAGSAADSAGYPDEWPAIAALKAAGAATVWARRASPIGAAEQEWDVLLDGRHLRTVVLPGPLRVTDIRGERILGILTDDLGVEYIVVFSR